LFESSSSIIVFDIDIDVGVFSRCDGNATTWRQPRHHRIADPFFAHAAVVVIVVVNDENE
jgi:hypothetical protein